MFNGLDRNHYVALFDTIDYILETPMIARSISADLLTCSDYMWLPPEPVSILIIFVLVISSQKDHCARLMFTT